MTEINLKGNPFYLKDEQIDNIKLIMSKMTVREKVGQLFLSLIHI